MLIKVEGVVLSDGRKMGVDLCLVATGIQPNAELAREAGLAVRRGIVVVDWMATSDPRIFAAGDVTEHEGRVQGLWPTSMEQAHMAATNLLGGDLRYTGAVVPVKLKVPGIDVLAIGETEAPGEGGPRSAFWRPKPPPVSQARSQRWKDLRRHPHRTRGIDGASFQSRGG